MQTVQINIFKFNELPTEKAKRRARDYWRERVEFSWDDESIESIEVFCSDFGVNLTDWHVRAYSPHHFKTDVNNLNFLGLKMSQVNRDNMPTGYYLDSSLWYTFHDEFKRTGDAKAAFIEALDQAFTDWRKDMESQLEDEYIDEQLIDNDFDFTEDGEIF